ncbi:MAG: hypothetical protein AAGG47_08810, partial [Pseudomonadota bacterium]
ATDVFLLAGGGTIDTGNFSVTVNADFDGIGGLTKTGVGTLFYEGFSFPIGTTSITQGTLGGSGILEGDLVIDAGATIAPGSSPGKFEAESTTINGSYAYEVDGTTADLLVVNGDLTLGAGSTLDVSTLGGGATAATYVVATYTGSLTGTFAGGENGVPAGYSVAYNHPGGTGNQIALVSAVAPDPYDTWIESFYPGETDPNIIGKTADPDNDGQSNKLEFAHGGAPNNPSDRARVFTLVADSDGDVDSDPELLLTVAVRSGTPAFAGTPSPTASHDGCTYTIEGSTDLTTFTSPVTPVGTVATGLATAPAGYEYRTFSLDGTTDTIKNGQLRSVVNF